MSDPWVDLSRKGVELNRETCLALMVEKLRQLEELSNAMAGLSSDSRWLTIGEGYRFSSEKIVEMARRRLSA